jgi:hypothetical protein
MSTQRREQQPKIVTVGFAERDGRGIAYAVGGSGGRGPAVRVGFACRPLPALLGRDVAYAALAAVAEELLRRGVSNVRFRIDDERLPQDIAERRAMPNALIVPYVRLRCALNRFHEAVVEPADDDIARDASARARADAWLNLAA